MSSAQDRYVIIGTAGHVDHGKTELIKTLTGTDTDRLKEEKARGITIDLGFASFRLPGGEIAGVVDVPGHERFISNMLAGIGGIDLVLLVVDVTEGVMPQTHEHMQIMDLLQIPRGIVVLTKCDLSEEEWIDLVEEEVREEVSHTFLKNAPFCRVSSVTGEGMDELRRLIAENVALLPSKDADGPLRLPVDRHFTMSGFGTVVTGTILSGTVRVGETLEVLPAEEKTRVREVQVHGNKVEEAYAGQRCALNLAGLERAVLERGSVVGTPAIFDQTTRLDGRLTLLPEAPRPVKFRDPVHFYLGTGRVVAEVALLDRDEMQPGESAIVQFHLDRPIVAHREDRYIIRSYSPMITIGGGRVLDPRPEKHRRFRKEIMESLIEMESGEKAFLLQKILDKQCITAKELETVSGMGKEKITANLKELEGEKKIVQMVDQWVVGQALVAWRHRLLEETERFHAENPLIPGIPHATLKGALPRKVSPKAYEKLLGQVVAEGFLQQRGEGLCIPGFTPEPTEEQTLDLERLEGAYRKAGAMAKNKNETLAQLGMPSSKADPYFAYLFGMGRLVKLNDESFFHKETYDRALQVLIDHFAKHDTLILPDYRDMIGSARKQTQGILEHFDGLKYTMRRGDERVAWKLPKEDPGK
ncbi:MAG: selenocysteine-specific translation elongation factor [Desulfuromonas sp.]|uniref:selenocysteine-specific translation elongation factor n=1 Tax=Desulfuromonas sp. TaxID=892 RepID=UPI000CB73EB0|nr:selenocysteine-specific translation elongation factor [Desulfuromonas sp.]PLX81679.1 MAG: selenocysteine-specific translation elongation factor [Desulfuromonas sp.]